MLKKFPEFCELQSVLWCLKEPATRTYHESLESTPPTKSSFSMIHFKLCFYYSDFPVSPFFYGFPATKLSEISHVLRHAFKC